MIVKNFTLITKDWLLKEQTKKVMFALNSASAMSGEYDQAAMFVGGCVRNSLLGKGVDDIDIATIFPPEKTIEILQAHDIKVIPTGLKHGTVTALIDGISFEITTLRLDVETDGRHAQVEFTDDWQKDASRRDFTMNALYLSADGVHIFDFFDGLKDLSNQHVRFIGNPHQRIEEDYLRILRFFRFTSYYGDGNFDEDGLKACEKLRLGIESLSKERIQVEFFKILKAPQAFETLKIMQDHEILETFIDEPNISRDLKQYIEWENKFCDNIYALFRLYILAREGMSPEDLFQEFRLSKDEKKSLYKMESFMEDEQAVAPNLFYCFYFYGTQKTIRGLFLKNIANADFENFIPSIKREKQAWKKPVCPLSAQDLMERGFKQNRELGEILKKIENAWALSHGSMDKNELLELISA